ncbi:PepSY-associated TM helix domain-containing protein [Candidatus Protofrankia californiensis]|uniref:PepSY-associated TM helix domain-containing protein n=1 Tax=Candidatus Protofrankia californiensis TaxID=1839754 RepID=UPI001F49FEC9|nr:PepSY domain-containing protein [Candidatus Protofrankia californiensis]
MTTVDHPGLPPGEPAAAPGPAGAPDPDTPRVDPSAAGTFPLTSTGWRQLLIRLHFYAGVLVAPFLVVAALTGLAYTFTPQLDRLVYADELHVDQAGASPRPLAEQVTAARAAHPEGTVSAVLTGDGADRTTRVVLDVPELGEKQRTVYVDPYTGQVRGALTTWWGSTPLTTWLDDLHRNLHLGAVGRNYSEVAASWLWVVALGGLVLWVARRRRDRRVRRVLLPDLAARGRRRTMAWHGSVGVWLVVGLLFLSATGLTWSHYAGENFSAVLDATGSRTPELDTTLPDQPQPASAGGGHHGQSVGEPSASGDALIAGQVDAVLAVARDAGLDGPVEISPPADAGTAWTVAQTDNQWPVRLDQAGVHPESGQVVRELRWADYPLLAKLTKLGITAHMGELFGLANQILLASLMLGLLCVIVWGYRMWWQRRPTRPDRQALVGPPPARGAWRKLPRPGLAVTVVLTAAVGWALPVLGVMLLAFLAVDVAVGAVRRTRRAARPPA